MTQDEIKIISKKLCESTDNGDFEGTWIEFEDVDEVRTSFIYDEILDKIVVDFGTESMTNELADRWEKYCIKNDIPFDKILLLNLNARHEREYLHTTQYFLYRCKNILNNKIHYPLVGEEGKGWSYAWNENYGKVDLNSPKEKIFNCLNYHFHLHRDFVWDWLEKNDLLKYGFCSYRVRGIELPKGYELEDVYTDSCDWSFGTFNPIVTEKSYFSVITESHHEFSNDDGLLISEKTSKALVSHPFIVTGNYGLLEYLREKGFETYPELFDESYDEEGDPTKRLEIVLENIKRLCEMDEMELKKIYDSVIWKVEHNRNVMKEYPTDPLIERLKKKFPIVNGDSAFNEHLSY